MGLEELNDIADGSLNDLTNGISFVYIIIFPYFIIYVIKTCCFGRDQPKFYTIGIWGTSQYKDVVLTV